MNYDTQNRFQKAVAQRQSRKTFAPNLPWVTITGLAKVDGQMMGFGSAMITFNQDTKLYSVALPALDVEKRGMKDSRRLIRFSGETIAVVKSHLIERFGEAAVVFSETNPNAGKDAVSDAREAITSEREQAAAERAKAQNETKALENHWQMCLDNPGIVAQVWYDQALKLMGPFSGVGMDFDGDRRDFFQWPFEGDKPTNENWLALVKICHEVVGVPDYAAPNLTEMIRAYRYGKEHKCFHQVKVYRRSQGYLKNQVHPVTAENANVTAAQAYASAVAKVNKLQLPAGYNLTKERALAAGLSEVEFEQLVKPIEDARAADFRDLKSHVESARPILRPSQRRGY
jgi:hypothetical protein